MYRTPQVDGDTALYVAAKAGHDEAVRALLEVPATKVNWQNHKGALDVPAMHDVTKTIVETYDSYSCAMSRASRRLPQLWKYLNPFVRACCVSNHIGLAMQR